MRDRVVIVTVVVSLINGFLLVNHLGLVVVTVVLFLINTWKREMLLTSGNQDR